MKSVKFKPIHFRDLVQRDCTEELIEKEDLAFTKMMTDVSFSIVDDVGKAVAVYGLHFINRDCAECWLVSKPKDNVEALAVFRVLKKAIEKSKLRRLECAVPVSNSQGRRLAHDLGFRLEAVSDNYFEDGTDAYRFGLVRKEA